MEGLITIDGDSVLLELTGPAMCWPLKFQVPDGGGANREDWRAEGPCAQLSRDEISVRDQGCSNARVRIPVSNEIRDRVYPVATLIQDRGLWLNTMALQAETACGSINWTLRPENGGSIVVHGAPTSAPVALSPRYGAGYLPLSALFLTRPEFAKTDLLLPANLSPAWAKEIESTVRALRSAYGGAADVQPFVAVALSKGRGYPNWQANVAGPNMVQLNLFDFPQDVTPNLSGKIRGVLAHEWAHTLGSPPQRLAPRTPLLEGQAEAGRLFASTSLGWLHAAELSAELSRMANQCVLATGSGQINKDTPLDRGRAPYDCGGVLYALALWPRASQWQSALASDCSSSICAAEAVASSLQLGATPMSEIEHALHQARIGFSTRELTQVEKAEAMVNWFSSIMRSDCGRSVGFEIRGDSFRVARIRSCKTLTEGLEIVSANGMPLFGPEGSRPLPDLTCKSNGTLSLGTKTGEVVTLACSANYVLPSHLFVVGVPVNIPSLHATERAI